MPKFLKKNIYVSLIHGFVPGIFSKNSKMPKFLKKKQLLTCAGIKFRTRSLLKNLEARYQIEKRSNLR